MSNAAHWETVYGKREPTRQGWYTPRPEPSVTWIQSLGLEPGDRVLDAGGGASTLVDHLLGHGHAHVTVADLSETALDHARLRLGPDADRVEWLSGDILSLPLEEASVSVWHDRAVFHFLHDEKDRTRYRHQVTLAVRPGGRFIIGSFRQEAPDVCSGLPVRRHSAEELSAYFGEGFTLDKTEETVHVTPGGVEQAYVFLLLTRQRTGSET